MTRKEIRLAPASLLQIELETGLIYLDLVPIGIANEAWLEHARVDFVPVPFSEPTPAEWAEALAKLNRYPTLVQHG